MPTRGSRQGDPLSPLLFVVYAQGLSSLMTSYQNRGKFFGIPFIRNELYERTLFFKVDSQSRSQVKQCLHKYEIVSGQFINFVKSVIAFSSKTSNDVIQATQ